MKTIDLSRGMIAIVDSNDYEKLSRFKWCFNGKYAMRNDYSTGKKVSIYMHKEVSGKKEGLDTDHINGDKLDNRKSNLRLCTRAENGRNRNIMNINNKSGYIGVSFHRHSNKWHSQIGYNMKVISLGYFKLKEEAIKARELAESKYFLSNQIN